MVRQYRSPGSVRGRWYAPLKLATIVFAVVCIAGPALGLQWNVGTRRIVIPAGTVDSGAMIEPSAVVANYGDSTATFTVLYSIGTFYSSTRTVTSLAPGESLAVAFDTWPAIQRGSQTARCSTQLAPDESTANDRATRTFTVRVRDMGVDSIMTPKGNVNLGVTVTPQARVTNHGTGNANFQARLRIGTFYSESSFVNGMASGTSRTISFTNWTPDSLGTFAVSCTMMQNLDQVLTNNLVLDSCHVITLAKDAGTMRVVAPTAIVDSGAVFQPQAMVRNTGTDTISFPAIFTISGGYADTQQVTNLASLDSALVTFADWTASPLGTLVTRCSTALAADSNATNNARSDSVKVIIRTTDVGAVRFTAPPDTVDSGTVVPVKAWVRNFGLVMQSFPVRVRLGSLYSDTVQVDSLAAGDSLEVTFADYPVAVRGSQTVRCSTMLTGDQIVTNNLFWKWVFRRVRDVGVQSITAPPGVVPEDTVVIPAATVRRFGNAPDSFPVIFRIGTFYEDTVRTNDTLGLVTFKPCTLSVSGTYSVVCSTAMNLDVIPANDAVFDSVQVADVGISATEQGPGLPRTVTLTGNGPFAGRVAIQYGLPRSAAIRLEVYDASGRLVRVVASGPCQAGYHNADWKCTDERGRTVAQGTYFVRLVADEVTLTSKVVKAE
ncbi:T9SS type A sorting domain-containing protein [candidate division WOR-3 bacterium]|uniref:T9SS type A sorting domain-containing protein n=1 Tax=candidate division WOR-3 bacterium TaxID=2052148 RepID=A0A937XEG1_UNCW3|nr:T9SS type A sorting domain-containing protein [candidate division WOR-3 bacterium]